MFLEKPSLPPPPPLPPPPSVEEIRRNTAASLHHEQTVDYTEQQDIENTVKGVVPKPRQFAQAVNSQPEIEESLPENRNGDNERYKPSPFLSQILKEVSSSDLNTSVEQRNNFDEGREESGGEETLYKYDLSPSSDLQTYNSNLSPVYSNSPVNSTNMSSDVPQASLFLEEYKNITERCLEEPSRPEQLHVPVEHYSRSPARYDDNYYGIPIDRMHGGAPLNFKNNVSAYSPLHSLLPGYQDNAFSSMRENVLQENVTDNEEDFNRSSQPPYYELPAVQNSPAHHPLSLNHPKPMHHSPPSQRQQPGYGKYTSLNVSTDSTSSLDSPFDVIAETLKTVHHNEKLLLNNKEFTSPKLLPSDNKIISPSPDLQPVIDRLALYVAKNGEEFETGIKEKHDPRFDFLNPWNMYHSYYMHKKKTNLCELEKQLKEGTKLATLFLACI